MRKVVLLGPLGPRREKRNGGLPRRLWALRPWPDLGRLATRKGTPRR
jgi:hypothetical protein